MYFLFHFVVLFSISNVVFISVYKKAVIEIIESSFSPSIGFHKHTHITNKHTMPFHRFHAVFFASTKHKTHKKASEWATG